MWLLLLIGPKGPHFIFVLELVLVILLRAFVIFISHVMLDFIRFVMCFCQFYFYLAFIYFVLIRLTLALISDGCQDNIKTFLFVFKDIHLVCTFYFYFRFQMILMVWF